MPRGTTSTDLVPFASIIPNFDYPYRLLRRPHARLVVTPTTHPACRCDNPAETAPDRAYAIILWSIPYLVGCKPPVRRLGIIFQRLSLSRNMDSQQSDDYGTQQQPDSPRTSRRPFHRRHHSTAEPSETSPLLTTSRSRIRIDNRGRSPRPAARLSRHQSYTGSLSQPSTSTRA